MGDLRKKKPERKVLRCMADEVSEGKEEPVKNRDACGKLTRNPVPVCLCLEYIIEVNFKSNEQNSSLFTFIYLLTEYFST